MPSTVRTYRRLVGPGRRALWLALLFAGLLQSGTQVRAIDLDFTAIVAESGRYATNGLYMGQAYALAVEWVNNAGGLVVGDTRYTLKLTTFDDESQPIVATRAAERAVRDSGRRFLLGPYGTALARAIAPVVERHGAVMLEAAGAVRPTGTRQYRSVFSLVGDPGAGMAEVIRTVADSVGAEAAGRLRIMLAASEDWVARSLRDRVLGEAGRTGMAVISEISLLYGAPDMGRLVDMVRRERPDILLLISQATGTRDLLQRLASRRVHVRLVAATACAAAGLTDLGLAGRGVVCPVGWHPELGWSDPIFGSPAAFAKAFQSRYRRPPSARAAAAAAAVSVLVDAIRRSGSVEADIVRDVLSSERFETLIGPVRFDATGRNVAIRPPLVQYNRDGMATLVAPTTSAPSTLRFPGR